MQMFPIEGSECGGDITPNNKSRLTDINVD